jgi:hypothetical protein
MYTRTVWDRWTHLSRMTWCAKHWTEYAICNFLFVWHEASRRWLCRLRVFWCVTPLVRRQPDVSEEHSLHLQGRRVSQARTSKQDLKARDSGILIFLLKTMFRRRTGPIDWAKQSRPFTWRRRGNLVSELLFQTKIRTMGNVQKVIHFKKPAAQLSACFRWFLAWLTLRPWSRWPYVPLKCLALSEVHCVTTRKTTVNVSFVIFEGVPAVIEDCFSSSSDKVLRGCIVCFSWIERSTYHISLRAY